MACPYLVVDELFSNTPNVLTLFKVPSINNSYSNSSFCFSVPIDKMDGLPMLYVFVNIQIDTMHFIDTIRHNFDSGARLALVSTIQFVTALQVSVLL